MILENAVIEQMKLTVKEKLPEVVAGEMKLFIEQAEDLKKAHESALQQIKRLEEVNKEHKEEKAKLKEIIAAHVDLDQRQACLDSRLAGIVKREQEQELTRTKYEMAVLEKYVTNIERFSALMFAHPESVKNSSVNRYGSMPVAVAQGGSSGYTPGDQVSNYPTNSSGNETIVETQHKSINVDSVIEKKI